MAESAARQAHDLGRLGLHSRGAVGDSRDSSKGRDLGHGEGFGGRAVGVEDRKPQ
jgi:hypothetical protein